MKTSFPCQWLYKHYKSLNFKSAYDCIIQIKHVSSPKRQNGIMNDSDFWVSINTVVSEGFTPDGLIKLDCYAEQFISRELVYKRFSPVEQHGCSAGGSCHVIASLLAGAETKANYVIEGVSDFKREFQCGAQQALRIEGWAKSTGVLDR